VFCLWSDRSKFITLLWFLIYTFVQVLFLSLVVNFYFFNCHFPVITLGQDLFSGAYLNKLLFVGYMVIENSLIYGIHQVRCFFF
jgi:hypothetical protein